MTDIKRLQEAKKKGKLANMDSPSSKERNSKDMNQCWLFKSHKMFA